MKFLLDTHVLIWFITDHPKLPLSIKAKIEDTNNSCFFSIASFWEMAIKSSMNRLQLKADLIEIFDIIIESDFKILPIDIPHIVTNSSLPFHHQDPFDRMIISQAISEQLTIISKDRFFNEYSVNIYWEK